MFVKGNQALFNRCCDPKALAKMRKTTYNMSHITCHRIKFFSKTHVFMYECKKHDPNLVKAINYQKQKLMYLLQ